MHLNWLFVAGRLRVKQKNNNALTLPDYFSRFEDNSKILRIISAVVILVFFTIYCASGVVAGGLLFESTFNMSYEKAMVRGISDYCLHLLGGFLAVSWMILFKLHDLRIDSTYCCNPFFRE